MALEHTRDLGAVMTRRRITVAWFWLALVLTAGSTWLWWFRGVPFARPPNLWNQATVHIAGPWVIWTASGWLARRR